MSCSHPMHSSAETLQMRSTQASILQLWLRQKRLVPDIMLSPTMMIASFAIAGMIPQKMAHEEIK